MCQVCSNIYPRYNNERVICCKNVREIPKKYENIKELLCDKTKITRLYGFRFLTNLSCSHTNISELPRSLTMLMYLNCSFTPIKVIPSEFTHLSDLDCQNTQVEDIPETLIHLKILTTCNTKIRTISPKLVRLQYINISNTLIKKIPSELVNLRSINCSNTKIQRVNTYVDLHTLDCSFSEVDYISYGNSKLNDINCAYTKVTRLSKWLVNLVELICDNTKIRELPNAPILTHLSCNYTSLIFIPSFPSMQYLKCRGTMLKTSTITQRVDVHQCDCIDLLNFSAKVYKCSQYLKEVLIIQRTYRNYQKRKYALIYRITPFPSDVLKIIAMY